MENINVKKPIKEIYKYLPLWITNGLDCLSKVQIGEIMEIRLRLNSPVAFVIKGVSWFLGKSGYVYSDIKGEMPLISREDLSDIFKKMCSYSFHAYEDQISHGFITLNGGHRVGISGYFVDDKASLGVRDITSLNIRIAREIKDCSNDIVENIFSSKLKGLLIISPPACGKTTILRDIAQKLSSGFCGRYTNVCVVDERGELAGLNNGEFTFNLGYCADVISGCSKDKAIERAIRTLSPQVIICDEAGTTQEIYAISQGFNSGAAIITTAHASTEEEIYTRPQILALLNSGAFQNVVILNGTSKPGTIKAIKEVKFNAENNRSGCNFTLCDIDWSRKDTIPTQKSETPRNNNINAYISF